METRKLKEKCEILFDYFDSPDNLIPPERPSLEGLLGDLFAEEWKCIEGVVEEAGVWDETVDLISQRSKVGFALGYVTGRLLDPGNRKILDVVEMVERVVKEKQVLLYLPREKRAA